MIEEVVGEKVSKVGDVETQVEEDIVDEELEEKEG